MPDLSELPSNKLNLYLIKEKFTSYESAVKNPSDPFLKKKDLDGIGVVYYKESVSRPPQWIQDFFLNHPAIDPTVFSSSNTCAVLLVQVNHNGKVRMFAIPFGIGRYLLKDLATESRFGLITTLNILQSNSIRSLGKTTLSSNPKISKEQISVAGGANDFQINIERDLVESITGTSTNQDFGKMITGKDSLSVTTKVNINTLKPFLGKTLEIYNKTDYKKEFKWIDQIKEVKDEHLINQLDQELVNGINNSNKINAWLAVPELLAWEDFEGFKYSTRKKDDFHDELDIDIYLKEKNSTKIEVADLIDDTVSYWSESKSSYTKSWSVYHCINAEVNYTGDGNKYLLDKSKWFKIEPSFVREVEKEFKSIKTYPKKFPDFNHKCENSYNVALASSLGSLCLDAKNLTYGGGSSKIEVCDILTNQKEFIHIKKFGGSASLSHLFAQGYVSGELFVTDSAFRKAVRKKYLTPPYDVLFPDSKPSISDYSIVYVVITRSKKSFNVPFFSKVNLKNFKRSLEGYGYNLYLAKALNVTPPKPPKKKP